MQLASFPCDFQAAHASVAVNPARLLISQALLERCSLVSYAKALMSLYNAQLVKNFSLLADVNCSF